MAIRSITKKCPFCKKVYEQRSISIRGRQIAEEDKWLFGSPARICPNCKRLFLDKDMQELAITSPRKRDKAIITEASCKIALMGLILCALIRLTGQATLSYICGAFGALWALADLALYPVRMKKLARERQASEKRLSDPSYAQMLKKAGYAVPEKYLHPTTEEEMK